MKKKKKVKTLVVPEPEYTLHGQPSTLFDVLVAASEILKNEREDKYTQFLIDCGVDIEVFKKVKYRGRDREYTLQEFVDLSISARTMKVLFGDDSDEYWAVMRRIPLGGNALKAGVKTNPELAQIIIDRDLDITEANLEFGEHWLDEFLVVDADDADAQIKNKRRTCSSAIKFRARSRFIFRWRHRRGGGKKNNFDF